MPLLKLADQIDSGLHNVIANPDHTPDSEPNPISSLDQMSRYRGIILGEKCSDDALKVLHQRQSEEKSLDSQRFAVVDDDYGTAGLLLVQAHSDRRFRCSPPCAGELLWWNVIGFMTWDDIESFASTEPN